MTKIRENCNFVQVLVTTMGFVIGLGSAAFAAPGYDVNGDGNEGLAEAIHSLQVTSELVIPTTGYDVNGDGVEGLAETIHSLQVTSGLLPVAAFPPIGIFTNSIGMAFNHIEPGAFTMGSPESEIGRFTNEVVHEVTLTTSFYLQTTEVTQRQWQEVIGNNPASFDSGQELPVESVTWYEAAYFANAVSTADGRSVCYTLSGCSGDPGAGMTCTSASINSGCTGYRLPTEAQWEYAARAGTTTAFYNGGITDIICNEVNAAAIGWYCGNADDMTHPVAQKVPNNWWLYDMSGNVWEWCEDWYGEYDASPAIDPAGAAFGVGRVIRGGGWGNVSRNQRSAQRSFTAPETLYNHLGFRLSLTGALSKLVIPGP